MIGDFHSKMPVPVLKFVRLSIALIVYRTNLDFLTSKNSIYGIVLPTIFAAAIASPQ